MRIGRDPTGQGVMMLLGGIVFDVITFRKSFWTEPVVWYGTRPASNTHTPPYRPQGTEAVVWRSSISGIGILMTVIGLAVIIRNLLNK
jgi:hypothetical protein